MAGKQADFTGFGLAKDINQRHPLRADYSRSHILEVIGNSIYFICQLNKSTVSRTKPLPAIIFEMPITVFTQEKRLQISVLAALSITIMLFTVVHLRHFMPTRHHALDCNGFFVGDFSECVGMKSEERVEEQRQRAGKEDWL